MNGEATYQRQSWIPDTPTVQQVVSIPAATADNHPVPTIIQEHKLYFKPAYNCTYVYAGPRKLYYMGCTSNSLTIYM